MRRLVVPEVSLITSWCVSHQGDSAHEEDAGLLGLRIALRNGIGVHDLYFLAQSDIPWYAQKAGVDAIPDPLAFVSSLSPWHLDRIAEGLQELVSLDYRGSLIGPCPHFVSLTTYWPFLSSVEFEDLRWQSIGVIQRSLYLAARLGCKCVVIVGGVAIPATAQYRQDATLRPDIWRDRSLEVLAHSLVEVYSDSIFGYRLGSELPPVAVDIEPGASQLINNVQQFEELVSLLKCEPLETEGKVMLNVNVAHCLLLEAVRGEGDPASQSVYEQIERLHNKIAHFHISDHAGTHAADLTPGTYHYRQDYELWLKLAIDLATKRGHGLAPQFSGSVAVKLEACNEIHEAARGIGLVHRWLQSIVLESDHIARRTKSEIELSQGALMVVDLGNSTKEFYGGSDSTVQAYHRIESVISEICHHVQRHRGSVFSYTGDGVIALFSQHDFSSQQKTAAACVEAARGVIVDKDVMGGHGELLEHMTIRVALHWGFAYIPTHGSLGYQIIGQDVVVSTRLCDWLANTVESGLPPATRGYLVGWTEEFHRVLIEGTSAYTGLATVWGEVEFKGLTMQSLGGSEDLLRQFSVFIADGVRIRDERPGEIQSRVPVG